MAALAAPMTVTAQDGETLDALVWRVLGRGPGAVEPVLEANPGLADLGCVLPRGRKVLIPVAADAPAATPSVSLWD
jgi:phage tail protein X